MASWDLVKTKPAKRDPWAVVSQKPAPGKRQVLQNSDDPEALRKDAKRKAPELEEYLKAIAAKVPGTKLDGVRDEKDPTRVAEKVDVGKSVETQSDHLAGRFTVDSENTKEKLAKALHDHLDVVKRDDHFSNDKGTNGFRADTHQVVVPGKPNDALKTAEVQITTKPQVKVAEETHEKYEQQRSAQAQGRTKEAERLGKELKRANDRSAAGFKSLHERKIKARPSSSARTFAKGDMMLIANPRTGRFDLHAARTGVIQFWNAESRRARVRETTGRQLRSVRDNEMVKIAPLVAGEANTETAEEAKHLKFVTDNLLDLICKYLRDNTAEKFQTPDVSTDRAKLLLPDFQHEPTKTNDDVCQAAHALAHCVLHTLCDLPIDPDRPDVLFVIGSPASGKTTSVEMADPRPTMAFRYETVPVDTDSIAECVKHVVDSGRFVQMNVFYVSDPAETVDRMVKRALVIGRAVDVDMMSRAYVKIPAIAAELQNKFGDQIQVNCFDNSRKPADIQAHVGTVDPAIQSVRTKTSAKVKRQMNERLEDLKQARQVSAAVYRAAGGGASDSRAAQ